MRPTDIFPLTCRSCPVLSFTYIVCFSSADLHAIKQSFNPLLPWWLHSPLFTFHPRNPLSITIFLNSIILLFWIVPLPPPFYSYPTDYSLKGLLVSLSCPLLSYSLESPFLSIERLPNARYSSQQGNNFLYIFTQYFYLRLPLHSSAGICSFIPTIPIYPATDLEHCFRI